MGYVDICQHSAYFKFIPSTHTFTHFHTIWGLWTNRAKSGHCLCYIPGLSCWVAMAVSMADPMAEATTPSAILFFWRLWSARLCFPLPNASVSRSLWERDGISFTDQSVMWNKSGIQLKSRLFHLSVQSPFCQAYWNVMKRTKEKTNKIKNYTITKKPTHSFKKQMRSMSMIQSIIQSQTPTPKKSHSCIHNYVNGQWK